VSYAEEVCSKVEPIGIQQVEVAEQGGQENGKREIPENLTNLFDKSKGELNGQEQTQLRELLCEFDAVLEQSSGLIFTCQYPKLPTSWEYHPFSAQAPSHASTRGNGNTSFS
jgi:hypothetical protein